MRQNSQNRSILNNILADEINSHAECVNVTYSVHEQCGFSISFTYFISSSIPKNCLLVLSTNSRKTKLVKTMR